MRNPTLTLDAEGVRYAVTFDRWDALQTNRARWCWSVGTIDGDGWRGDDLTTVALANDDNGYPRPNMADALASLLTFLGANVDAIEHEQRTGRPAESADLFPRDLFDRVALDSDLLAALAADVNGAAR
jgi:hypothetical protein